MNSYLLGIGGTVLAAGFFAAGVASVRQPALLPDVVMAESEADASFDAAIRDFLDRHPEVVIEASERHAARVEQEKADAVKVTLAERRDEIMSDPAAAVLGNPDGNITLVEFFDYNCGYCRRGHEDITAVLDTFPDVRVVLRPFPILGPESARAHQVAQAFRNLHPDKYRAFHDALLTTPGQADDAVAMKIAIDLGADEAKLREAMNAQDIGDGFNRTYALAQALDITGTPSYVLGDEVIGGAVGFDTLAAKIKALSGASQ